jgi:hypothetical protein
VGRADRDSWPTAGRLFGAANKILSTITPVHPRVLITTETVARLNRGMDTDPVLRSPYASVRGQTDRLLGGEVSEAAVLGNYHPVREHVEPLAFAT